jgi:erythromycin esterase
MKTLKTLFLTIAVISIISCNKDNQVVKTELPNTQKIIEVFNTENFLAKQLPFSAVPTNNYSDLLPLVSLWNTKKVIGFGEATHGTSEFHTTKHRMLQMLSNELQFRNLTIEDNFSAVLKLNEFVKTGNGNVDQLINGLRSSVYKNIEFKNIILWMKDYNLGKSDENKLYVFGFDAQNVKPSAVAIKEYVSLYDTSYLTTYDNLAQSFLADLTNYNSQQEAIDDIPNLKVKIGQIKNHIQATNSYLNGAGTDNYKILLQHVRIIEQALNQYTGFINSADDGFETRDANMAENIQFIDNLRGNNSKIMVWVHNGHINVQKQNYFGGRDINVLGTNLKNIYGSSFYSVGYIFNEGSFLATDANTGENKVFSLAPNEKCYLSNAIASYNIPTLFFDMTNNNTQLFNSVFDNDIPTFWIGATFDNNIENALFDLNMKKEFDGFIFVNKTTALHSL